MIKTLYNFKTGKKDMIEGKISDFTDETAKLYISQQPAAQGYFEIRRKLGDSVVEAMQATLTVQVGETPAPVPPVSGNKDN